MEVFYSKQARKVIEKLDVPTKHRIRQAIDKLPDGDIKQLSGRLNVFRLRVGDWRILFSYPDAETILVEKVAPRGNVYKEG